MKITCSSRTHFVTKLVLALHILITCYQENSGTKHTEEGWGFKVL